MDKKLTILIILFVITILLSFIFFRRKEKATETEKNKAIYETIAGILTSTSASVVTVILFYLLFGKDSNLFDNTN